MALSIVCTCKVVLKKLEFEGKLTLSVFFPNHSPVTPIRLSPKYTILKINLTFYCAD